MLSKSEVKVLGQFREFLMEPREMLCFSGPNLQTHKSALESLADKEMLVREQRDGAYSLTPNGYSAMNSCA